MAQKAKLLLFSHISNAQSITGAEKLLLQLAQRLSIYFECVLVAPGVGEITRLAGERGIRTILMKLPLLYEMYTPGPELSQEVQKLRESHYFVEVQHLLREEHADVVMTNTCVHVLPALVAHQLGLPVIWNITEVMVRTPFLPESLRIIDSYATRVMTISQCVRSRLQEYVAGEKLSLLYPSWEWSQFRTLYWTRFRHSRRAEMRLGPEHRLIGFISSFLTEEKGLGHFIDMALDLCEERGEVRFLILGMKNNKDYYKRCLDKVNTSKYFSRFTFIPYERSVESAYCAMDVLVIPSLLPEGFGLTALEGMVHGKLTAAYDAGGLSEVLGACGFGEYLAKIGESDELTDKVKALLTLPPEQAEAMKAAAQNLAEVHFGPHKYAERLHEEVIQISASAPGRLLFTDEDGGIVTPLRTPDPEVAAELPIHETAVDPPRRRRNKVILRRSRAKGRSKSTSRRRRHPRSKSQRKVRRLASSVRSSRSRNKRAPGSGRRKRRA